MKCAKHPRYEAKLKPRGTRADKLGCRDCWWVYRSKLLASAAQAQVEAEEIRKRLSEGCNHPEQFVEDWQWEHDNGYGRQTMVNGKMCKLCRARKHWTHSAHWMTEEEYYRPRRDDW
jgi:hypothetical protein